MISANYRIILKGGYKDLNCLITYTPILQVRGRATPPNNIYILVSKIATI